MPPPELPPPCATQVGPGLALRLFGSAARLGSDYTQTFAQTRLKLRTITLVGAVGFPLYGYVWTEFFPQPYENLPLRFFGMALCLVFWGLLYYQGRHAAQVSRLLPAYCYGLIVFCMPFFFTFMALKNGLNAVWSASAVCAILYLILLLDLRNMLVATGIGVALGIAAAMPEVPALAWEHAAILPVLGFALAGALVYKVNDDLLEALGAARTRAVAAVAGTIAHEMRTPLLAIRFDAEGLSERLTPIVGEPRLERAEAEAFAAACDRIVRQTGYANTVIDMLLANISDRPFDAEAFQVHAMGATVEAALEAYPFRPGERGLVAFRIEEDFDYRGSDTLMRHVLFNLLKNALRAVAEGGEAKTIPNSAPVAFRVYVEAGRGCVAVSDRGCGIPPNIQAHLFRPFVAGRPGGAGIGLAFVKRVVDSFAGAVVVHSDVDGTTVLVTLPPVARSAAVPAGPGRTVSSADPADVGRSDNMRR